MNVDTLLEYLIAALGAVSAGIVIMWRVERKEAERLLKHLDKLEIELAACRLERESLGRRLANAIGYSVHCREKDCPLKLELESRL
jgi:hypothetical protein